MKKYIAVFVASVSVIAAVGMKAPAQNLIVPMPQPVSISVKTTVPTVVTNTVVKPLTGWNVLSQQYLSQGNWRITATPLTTGNVPLGKTVPPILVLGSEILSATGATNINDITVGTLYSTISQIALTKGVQFLNSGIMTNAGTISH
jgi:hypothetical protein